VRRYISQTKESNQFLFIYVAQTSTVRKAGHVMMGRMGQIRTAERKTHSTKLKAKTKQF
jgi:hypothetical protein